MTLQEFCKEFGLSEWDPRSEIIFRAWENSLTVLTDQEYQRLQRRSLPVPDIPERRAESLILIIALLIIFLCLIQVEPAPEIPEIPGRAITGDYWELLEKFCN